MGGKAKKYIGTFDAGKTKITWDDGDIWTRLTALQKCNPKFSWSGARSQKLHKPSQRLMYRVSKAGDKGISVKVNSRRYNEFTHNVRGHILTKGDIITEKNNIFKCDIKSFRDSYELDSNSLKENKTPNGDLHLKQIFRCPKKHTL